MSPKVDKNEFRHFCNLEENDVVEEDEEEEEEEEEEGEEEEGDEEGEDKKEMGRGIWCLDD